MTEDHLTECLQQIQDTRKLLDRIQTDLRGAQEFRDAVFDLLEGTPFCAQADSQYDGLYSRLRAAVEAKTDPRQQAEALARVREERDTLKAYKDAVGVAPQFVADAKVGATVRGMREEIEGRRQTCHAIRCFDDAYTDSCVQSCQLLTRILAALDQEPTP
jgi:hypothetical protein